VAPPTNTTQGKISGIAQATPTFIDRYHHRIGFHSLTSELVKILTAPMLAFKTPRSIIATLQSPSTFQEFFREEYSIIKRACAKPRMKRIP